MMISAVITTHNRAGLLREAIDSVLAQEPCGAETEVVVVDDASTDDTAEVVASYHGVKYVRTRQGTAAGSRNVGIAHTQGNWLAFLDDDDVWLPHKIRRCVEEIAVQPQARLVFSAATICGPDLSPGPLWAGPSLAGKRDAYDAFLDEVITPSVVLMHREVFEAVGDFDAAIPRVEDRDMWLRVAHHGFRCAGISEPLVLYRMRADFHGEMDHQTYEITMRVLRQHLAMRHDRRPAWRRRQEVLWRTRGWYAGQILGAAQQARSAGQHAQATHFQRIAFRISPLHTLKAALAAR